MNVHRVMLFSQRQPVASFFIFEADISEKILHFPVKPATIYLQRVAFLRKSGCRKAVRLFLIG
jgi:hypothetical protein